MAKDLLRVSGLTTAFPTKAGSTVRAVDDVSFTVGQGETVCVVGESGSGKSVTSLSVMRLIENEGGRITSGEISFDGRDLAQLDQNAMRKIRGSELGMIFQEPMTALNPVFTVGDQIAESVLLHTDSSKKQAWDRALEMLRLVEISDPGVRAKQYPHQLSGGLRQRVMIALALACDPQLLIADEPTTALDVTIQAQILDLLRDLKDRLGMSLLLITHDMGVAAETADRIVVMYAGKVIEEASVADVFDAPHHPYTQGLLASIPGRKVTRGGRLHAIAGTIPALGDMPSGCRFHPRCPFAQDVCRAEQPVLREIDGRFVACVRAEESEVAAER
ncbi:MAG: peptide/nickel transport system ATP-binding protein [Kribbellaceae bacterium]|nr:peptide/nickel transport system ATP-binding protein [Kribbellaceae bacterium]